MGRTWRGRATRDWRAHLTHDERVVVAAIEAEQAEARKVISAAATKRKKTRNRAIMRASRDEKRQGEWDAYLTKDDHKIIAAMEDLKRGAQKRLATASARLRPIRSLCIARAGYVADIPASRAKVRKRVNAFNAKQRQT